MSTRFVIRKNSGDPRYPWTLLDAKCPNSDRHDFSREEMPAACNGNCDAYLSFAAAIRWIDLIR